LSTLSIAVKATPRSYQSFAPSKELWTLYHTDWNIYEIIYPIFCN